MLNYDMRSSEVILSSSNAFRWNGLKVEATHCRQAMQYCFLLYLVTFSFAPFFRDFFAVLCLLCLIPYYILDYKGSTWHFFDGKKFFLFFYAFLAFGIIFSQNIGNSFFLVSLHSFTSLTLPFVGMECVRSGREVRFVTWALVCALFLQGCNGVYQYVVGCDLVYATPIMFGRLTGSFGDYRVGNYMALVLIPATSVYYILRDSYARWAFPLTLILLSPAFFLLFFSYTRNAYITLAAAAMLLSILLRVFPWKLCFMGGIAFVGLLQFSDIRLSAAVIQGDGRWSLWSMAVNIFKEFPIVGAGIGQYNSAFRALGLSPERDAISIKHPHNIYLQFLSENGLVGFCLVMVFLFGILWWGYKNLRVLQKVRNAHKEAINEKRFVWLAAALFWCGWGAFLVSGIVGHNFFQRWWQALVMAHLGVMIGLIVSMLREKEKDI